MNIITWLLIGGLIGWVGSILIGTGSREGLIRNVVVGIAGAYIGSWLLSKLFESANQGGFSVGVIIASFLGAASLLLLVNRLSRA